MAIKFKNSVSLAPVSSTQTKISSFKSLVDGALKANNYENLLYLIETKIEAYPNTLVLADVDDTMTTTAGIVRNHNGYIVETGAFWCTAPWHNTHIEVNNQLGTKKVPWETLVKVDFKRCLEYTGHVPVNQSLNALLAKYLTTGKVLAVTHRHAIDSEKTLQQLSNVGVPFQERVADTEFLYQGEDLMNHGVFSIGTDPETHVRRHKGDMVRKLITSWPRAEQPNLVIVLEDSADNLKAIAEGLEAIGIAVIPVLLDAVEKMQPYSRNEKFCLDAYQSLAAEQGLAIPSDIQLHCANQCSLDVFKDESCSFVQPYYTRKEQECLNKLQNETTQENGDTLIIPSAIELHCQNICHINWMTDSHFDCASYTTL
jgi:hypothetical protein